MRKQSDVTDKRNRKKTKRLAASLSSSGKGRASSYRKPPASASIDKVAVKRPSTPKSAGVYNRLIIGVEMIPIIWAITVPLAIIKIPFANVSLKILVFNSSIFSRTNFSLPLWIVQGKSALFCYHFSSLLITYCLDISLVIRFQRSMIFFQGSKMFVCHLFRVHVQAEENIVVHTIKLL